MDLNASDGFWSHDAADQKLNEFDNVAPPRSDQSEAPELPKSQSTAGGGALPIIQFSKSCPVFVPDHSRAGTKDRTTRRVERAKRAVPFVAGDKEETTAVTAGLTWKDEGGVCKHWKLEAERLIVFPVNN